ncbi:unnamed protein product, partial [Protopolystoma xenopodis]
MVCRQPTFLLEDQSDLANWLAARGHLLSGHVELIQWPREGRTVGDHEVDSDACHRDSRYRYTGCLLVGFVTCQHDINWNGIKRPPEKIRRGLRSL